MDKKDLQLLKQKLKEKVPGFSNILQEEYGCGYNFILLYFKGKRNCKKSPTIGDIAIRLLRERDEKDRANKEFLNRI